MSKLDDDIRRALASADLSYDHEREQGVFRQMADLYQGKMRWMAVVATVESIVFVALIVLAAVQFFQADDTKWQIFYATCVVLLGMLLLLIKLWGWMQMNRNAIQRDIKHLELRVVERADAGQQ